MNSFVGVYYNATTRNPDETTKEIILKQLKRAYTRPKTRTMRTNDDGGDHPNTSGTKLNSPLIIHSFSHFDESSNISTCL